MQSSVRKFCYIHGCFVLEGGREDAIEVGEGEDTILKVYTRFNSTFYGGPKTGTNVDNIVLNQPRPCLQIWVPDYLLTGHPTELTACLDGRFFIPRRLRLCEDNVLESDSDPNDENPTECAVIDVTRIQPFDFLVNDNLQIEKS